MTENTPNVVVVPAETPEVPKTPFYKNKKILKPVGIALAGAAAAAIVITKFRKTEDSETVETTDENTSTYEVVVD